MTTIEPEALSSFVTRLYVAAGLPKQDAGLVADSLVDADLRGHSSHGVMRAPWYIDRVQSGVMAPVTDPTFLVDAGAIAVMDGHDGVGQVIAKRGMV